MYRRASASAHLYQRSIMIHELGRASLREPAVSVIKAICAVPYGVRATSLQGADGIERGPTLPERMEPRS
jgi:hypothetical protein